MFAKDIKFEITSKQWDEIQYKFSVKKQEIYERDLMIDEKDSKINELNQELNEQDEIIETQKKEYIELEQRLLKSEAENEKQEATMRAVLEKLNESLNLLELHGLQQKGRKHMKITDFDINMLDERT